MLSLVTPHRLKGGGVSRIEHFLNFYFGKCAVCSNSMLDFTLLETFSLCGPKLSASCWIFVFNYKEKPNVLINYFAVCLFALF